MYLPIFLPWAKQPTPHTPPPHLLPASSPRRCKERPGVKCKRENAVVQTVPTTSVSPLLSFLPPSFPPAPAFCLWLLFMIVSYTLLSLRWAGCRLQVRRTPQPMKNECRRAPWLWWTSPYVALSLFSIWLPPEKPAQHTHTWKTLWTKYLSCWRKMLRSGKYAVRGAFLSVCEHSHNVQDVEHLWDYFKPLLTKSDSPMKLLPRKVYWS